MTKRKFAVTRYRRSLARLLVNINFTKSFYTPVCVCYIIEFEYVGGNEST
jgi:hypothetical protein